MSACVRNLSFKLTESEYVLIKLKVFQQLSFILINTNQLIITIKFPSTSLYYIYIYYKFSLLYYTNSPI
jgi:hypothetical protein